MIINYDFSYINYSFDRHVTSFCISDDLLSFIWNYYAVVLHFWALIGYLILFHFLDNKTLVINELKSFVDIYVFNESVDRSFPVSIDNR